MKEKLLLALFLFVSVAGLAQKKSTLVLWNKDNTQTRVQLSTRPQVRITSDSLLVISPVATLRYAAADVLRFTYENVVSTNILSLSTNEKLRLTGNALLFSGNVKADAVKLFTLDGRSLPVSLQATNGGWKLSLTDVPAGSYVLNVEGRTCKFVKP